MSVVDDAVDGEVAEILLGGTHEGFLVCGVAAKDELLR
jgi:hypothetical protein